MWSMTALEYPVDGNEIPAAAEALYREGGRDKVVLFENPFAAGPHEPSVWADGLAIPLGVLPYRGGVYVQHGPDLLFLRDTDGDGFADDRRTVLTGFGVQDSHLLPHQFTRAPGGWLWLAQGAFNYGKVRRPNDALERAVQFDQARMAKVRPDGSEFTITTQGPCNIWGLVLTGEGDALIQEANDFGYPLMPFHEFANYPGCSNKQWRSYAPEFPGPARDFRMGGTGLSGLALSDARGAWPKPYANVMYLANPITRRIQAIRLHAEGTGWRLEKLPDFMTSSDEWFRPVALAFGPDGCLYIVDWYNKIISHNEVPRNHPERDKTRGRIWRVKHSAQRPFPVPNFAKLAPDALIAKLGGDSLAQSHLAWQTLADRELSKDALAHLAAIALDGSQSIARRAQALWVLEEHRAIERPLAEMLVKEADARLRREAVRAAADAGWEAREFAETFARLADDPHPEVRAAAIRGLGAVFPFEGTVDDTPTALKALLTFAKPPLDEPKAASTHSGKLIKVGAAYEREFDRYLVRLMIESRLEDDEAANLEDRRDVAERLARFLDSPEGAALPVEGRLVASLAMNPREGTPRMAALLPKLDRLPGEEEILRLAQHPDAPGVRAALTALLDRENLRAHVLETILSAQTRVDAAGIAPLLVQQVARMLDGENHDAVLAAQLAAAFRLRGAEPRLIALLDGTSAAPATLRVDALRALGALQSEAVDLFARLALKDADTNVRQEAISALASSAAKDAPARVLDLWMALPGAERKTVLEKLSATPHGARALLARVQAGTIEKASLDAALLDRMRAALGKDDSGLMALEQELSALLRPVLALDGSDDAWTRTGLQLDGAFTIEAWVRFEPEISNADGIFGSPGKVDLNFYEGRFRVFTFDAHGDVAVARKPVTPGVWTHVAASRSSDGIWKLYLDGELDATAEQAVDGEIDDVRIAWSAAPGGLHGALAEYRIWKRERGADEIRAEFDRSYADRERPEELIFYAAGAGSWGTLRKGAHFMKTMDGPPLLTRAEAEALDAKFARLRRLASEPGDIARGRALSAVCTACHLIGGTGVDLGPNLSGAGAMGLEALLRNIVTPNAAMESAYRIYRVELTSGDIREGFLANEMPGAVVLRNAGGTEARIERSQIREAGFLRRSLMPEGLLDGFSDEQARDLLAYLLSLR